MPINIDKIQTINTHDKFVKASMQHLEVAQEFFATHLPEKVLALVDLKTLKPLKDSFVDEILGSNMSDMVFEVQFSGEKGYLTVLLEHQSAPDYYMPYRIIKYMLQICSHHLKANPELKHLPLIYPAIIYHGREEYNAPLDFWSLFANPELAKSFYTEAYQLIDVTRISDDELRKKVYSGVMNYLLKHIFAPDISIYLDVIAPMLKEIGDKNFDYMATIICYTLNRAEGTNSEAILEKLSNMVPEKSRSDVMTIAEQLIAKGELRGKIIGKTEGKAEIVMCMLSNKLDISFIALMTGLTEQEVLAIKRQGQALN